MQPPQLQERHRDQNPVVESDRPKLPWQSPRLQSLCIEATKQSPGSGGDIDSSDLP